MSSWRRRRRNLSAALQTVPEKPETIGIQVKQLADGGRKTIMLPNGTASPASIPAGVESLQTPAGTFLYDPEQIEPKEIHQAVAENRLPEILGPADGGLGAPDKSQIQGEPIAVVARDANGTEVQATVTDRANLNRTLEQSRKVTPEGGAVGIEAMADVLAKRTAPAVTPDSFMQAAQSPETGTALATGKEEPVVLQDFVAGRGGFAEPARMVIRSPRDVSADEIRRTFFPDLGPDRLDIQKLRADDFMAAVQPGRQPFVLQFVDAAGRNTSAPAGIEERLGLRPGETYHLPQAPEAAREQPESQALALREPSVPPAYGRDVSIAVPGEQTSYPGRYAVRELADVIPSHNPFSFEPNPDYQHVNDRDYSRTGNAARVVKTASPEVFNPDFLTTDAPTAEHGAPIVDANGNALGGNSRTMALARVYQRGDPDAFMYRDAIKSKAQQFGIDPAEVDRFEKPVLVRELPGGVDAQKAITDFNKAAAAELSPEERAVSDGRRLSSETVQDIAGRLGDLGEAGTMAEALRGEDGAAVLNRLVSDGVLTEQEKGGYLDDRGNLTPEAKSRIGKALVGRLFDTPAEFRETTPAVRAKLERIAPQLLRVESRPEWSLTDKTRQAIALSEDARVHGMPVEDAARQSVIGGERSYSPDAIAMAKTIEQGPNKAAGAFRRYANDEALSREGSQGAFFTPPTRAEAFSDAFGGSTRAVGQRGGISPDLLTLGAGKFVKEDIIPTAKRVASDLVEAKDAITRIVAPQTRGSAAEFTGLNLRVRMAQFARRFDQGEQRLRDAKRFFNTRTPEQNYQFIDNVERGLGRGAIPGDAELEPMARMFSRMLDQRRQEVQNLGEGALKGFYQNYFPHIFERPEQASKFVASFFSGKRSMEGPKSFLQHRDFPTFREALDAGLKPVSDNPVDLVMMKAREMDRYLMAHATLRDLAENGIAKRVSGLGPDARQREMLGGSPIRPEWAVQKREDLPANFVSIRDPVGGGRWFAEEGAADVLNNFLSVGLRARSGAARILLGVNNTMNQSNLALSGFHLLAETVSSVAGRASLGFVKAMQGHPLDAAWHVASSPAAPFIDYLQGSKMLREWFKPGSEGAPVAAMIDSFTKGGGRARQGADFNNQAVEAMVKQARRGNFWGAAVRSPFAAIEAMSKPMFAVLVPRMKMGAFADIAQHEMERLGPGAKVEDVQRAMSSAWDHVENRLGQMTYDNLFWNRSFKDIMHLMVRSVGWNLGDLREMYSAAGALKGLVTGSGVGGRRGVDLHGLGFVMGYAFTAATMGAIYHYLHTGQGPQELRDYFFPKRDDGRRVVVAPYVKDSYQFARDLPGTMIHKTGPLVNTLAEMTTNKDYFDRPIRNLDDPLVKQLEQEGEFVGRQFLPFTIQEKAGPQTKSTRREAGYRAGSPERQTEHFLGVNPAPAALQPGYKPRKQPTR